MARSGTIWYAPSFTLYEETRFPPSLPWVLVPN